MCPSIVQPGIAPDAAAAPAVTAGLSANPTAQSRARTSLTIPAKYGSGINGVKRAPID